VGLILYLCGMMKLLDKLPKWLGTLIIGLVCIGILMLVAFLAHAFPTALEVVGVLAFLGMFGIIIGTIISSMMGREPF
jgi:hypothetical protein